MTTASEHTSPPLSLRAKLGLAACGVAFALLASVVALQFISFGPKGTEFNSIDDVRRAMLAPDQSSETATMTGDGQVSLRAIVEPHPSNSIIYSLRSNLDLTFVRARVQTNSCGMRSPERPIKKPAGVYRIALLGDSFTFGWGVEQEQTFAQKLEDNLNRMADGKLKIEVLNFGVPGYSTFQEVALFEEKGLDFDPDAALVYFVQNDFGMPFFIRDIGGNSGLLSSVKFVQLGRQLLEPDAMNKQIRAMGLDPNQALTRLANITARHGLKTFFTINPRKSWRTDLSRLPALKKRSGIQFIPLREGLLEYIRRHEIPEKDLTLSFDPHPSPIRHAILGSLLAPYFLDAAL